MNVTHVIGLWGAQFDIEYDYDLLKCRSGQTKDGVIYRDETGTGCVSDPVSVQKLGPGPNSQGLIRVLSIWNSFAIGNNNTGINGTGSLCELQFETLGNVGTTDLDFIAGKGAPPGVLKVTKWWKGTPSYPVATWIDSSVTVQ